MTCDVIPCVCATTAGQLQKLDKVLTYLRGLYGADKAYRLINYGAKVAGIPCNALWSLHIEGVAE